MEEEENRNGPRMRVWDEIFETGPGGGKKLFGRRHHSRDSSRWRNFNWPFAVGTKIGFHRWWPGHIIPGPRLRGRHGISVLTAKVSAIERQVAFVRHRDRIDNL